MILWSLTANAGSLT